MAQHSFDRSADGTAAYDSRRDRAFFGHPKGLAVLFQVEFWERFSYYGMKAILLYYMYATLTEGGLGIDKTTAKGIVLIYGSAVYLLSVVGGFAADRLIGARNAILYGGIVIMAGHISLAVPGAFFAWLGIALVALGTGFLKPNISSIVGDLYDEKDPRREGGFSIFYMSINLGAFLSPFVVAALRNTWGFHAGFAAAAVGMAFAIAIFVWGTKTLRGKGMAATNPIPPQDRPRLLVQAAVLLGLVAVIYLICLVGAPSPAMAVINMITIVCVLVSIAYFVVMFRSRQVTAEERSNLAAYIPLFLGSVAFSLVFEQASGPMAELAEKETDLLNGAISPELFQSVNPVFIVLLAPIFASLWTRRAGLFPNLVQKFALSLVILAASAFMLMWITSQWGPVNKAPFYWLALVFIVQTVAELFLSPVGLAATTLLAPRAFKSQAMAMWFLTVATGAAFGAQLVTKTEHLPKPQFYLLNGCITLAMAAVLFAVAPWAQRKMAALEARRREGHDETFGGPGAHAPVVQTRRSRLHG